MTKLSKRGSDWDDFHWETLRHIENYTVPQYGDRGDDIASEYTPDYCLSQVKKYIARFGTNSREGQEKLDLLKMAHYIQMAWTAIGEQDDKQGNSPLEEGESERADGISEG